ncbi:hypothetical protein AWR36_007810 [Microbulbifer flavimaris]|uniref:Nickel/cobalt transporter regulator n=2 Tax=Microbulbiferaceae TaxID=1706373 RepID=A0ABX4I0N3_9GAMM|nr:hypothetical protein AVO43_07785 [Microbulbifer sp. ZGT114]PCO05896.1 hypothetical protein AWR36_007810 [Microbulbifer flavimaris]
MSEEAIMIKPAIAAVISISLAAGASAVLAKPGNDLPPGLQKKVENGGDLPPGWKKKLRKGHILEHEIYRHGVIVQPVDRHGIVTISIQGEIVRLMHHTREIVDILSH